MRLSLKNTISYLYKLRTPSLGIPYSFLYKRFSRMVLIIAIFNNLNFYDKSLPFSAFF
ncbi:hypothetical protein ACFP3I_05070 [Chryseobacterium arachidis]|uniref:hypothetical protein n=1 Tax=Chryseobacterium arachidis TaxID=1416778 RepID=UPI00361AA852